MINREPIQNISRDIPPYPDPIYRPPPRPSRNTTTRNTVEIDRFGKFPYQEGSISETYQRLDRTNFQKPPELDSLINTGRLVQKIHIETD